MAHGFTFRLETLLRVRLAREREVQRRLAFANAELALLNRADELDQAALTEERQKLLAAQQGPLRAVELARGRAWIAHLQRQMAERGPLRLHHQQRIAQIMTELREARKQTRMIEKLKERRWNEFALGRRRREQARTDEVGQILHSRSEEARGA